MDGAEQQDAEMQENEEDERGEKRDRDDDGDTSGKRKQIEDMLVAMLEDVLMIEKVGDSVVDPKKRQKGRKREMDKLKEYKVFRRILRTMLPKCKKAISAVWYEKMKNDGCRSRLCVRDIAKTISQEYFAATPSQSSSRLLSALAHALELQVQSADLDTAFKHAPLEEAEYAEPPDEDKNDTKHEMYGRDFIWAVDKATNGCRGAPKAYQKWYRE